MLPGTSAWKRSDSMKSSSARAPAPLRAPARIPASSICLKQLSATTAVGACASGLPAKITSAAGLVAYETTIGRFPLLPAAPENCTVYASSQPSTTSTRFARSFRQ